MTDQQEWKPIMQKFIVTLEQALYTLQKTWKDIGYHKETRAIYYKQTLSAVNDLLNDMVAEAQNKKQLLLHNIKSLLKETTTLYTELHLNMVSNTYNEMPLYVMEEALRIDLQKLEHLKRERLLVLKELLAKEEVIAKKLGISTLKISANDIIKEEVITNIKKYIENLQEKTDRVQSVFSDIHVSVMKLMNDLDKTPSSSFEHLICNNPDDFVLSTTNMTKLMDFRDQLKVQLETKCHVKEMKEDLLTLWKYLDQPETSQSFLEKSYDAVTVNVLNAEIKRCEEEKKQNISKYVTHLRDKLVNLWDLCKFCEADRNLFAPFYSSKFTEDLLTLHEIEVERSLLYVALQSGVDQGLTQTCV